MKPLFTEKQQVTGGVITRNGRCFVYTPKPRPNHGELKWLPDKLKAGDCK